MRSRNISRIQIEDGTYLYWCPRCKRYLSKDKFCSNKLLKYRDCTHTYCKDCLHIIELDYRANKDYQTSLNFRLRHCYNSAKNRAKKLNLDFNLTLDYIKHLYESLKGLCAISGIPMTCYYGTGVNDTNISVDKIDPKKGYVIGNVLLVCWAVNKMKSTMNLEQLMFFCQSVINYLNKLKN